MNWVLACWYRPAEPQLLAPLGGQTPAPMPRVKPRNFDSLDGIQLMGFSVRRIQILLSPAM